MSKTAKVIIYIFLVIFMLCCPCTFLIIGSVSTSTQMTLSAKCTETTTAYLVDIDYRYDDDHDKMYYGTYYYYVDNEPYSWVSNTSYGNRSSVKDKIQIKYDPSNPLVTYYSGDNVPSFIFVLVGIIMLPICAILLGVIAYFMFRKSRYQK